MFASVPYDFARKVNPSLSNTRQRSVQYTLSDIYQQTDSMTLYRVPYSENTYWTHYKYGVQGSIPSDFSIEVVLIDQTDCRAVLNHQPRMNLNEWFPLSWPIPSLSTPSDKGLFIRVTHHVDPGTYHYSISLIGFIDLFPYSAAYLLTHKTRPILLFQRNIAAVEHTDTSYIIAKQKIRDNLLSFPYPIPMSKEY
jgi:hypothetical protein